MRNPVDVLREQSEVSREIHERTGAPLIDVPVPMSDAMRVFSTRGEWKEPPACAECMGELAVSVQGDIYCKSCGAVPFTVEDVQRALKAAKQKGFK